MNKLFLAVSSMIVAGFLMKSYRKLREQDTDDEVYRRERAAYEEYLKNKRRCADARATFNRMDAISTQRDGGLLSPIDTLQQMAPGRFS